MLGGGDHKKESNYKREKRREYQTYDGEDEPRNKRKRDETQNMEKKN